MSKHEHQSLPEADQEPRLSRRQKGEVEGHRNLSSVSVYAVVRAEGAEELKRPDASLWWSGVAAGLGISASIVAEGILHESFAGHPRQEAIENLGYTVGFALVILGRLQLFTENTVTAILPLLARPSPRMLRATARLWGIVLAANLAGTFLTALVTLHLGTAAPGHVAAMLEVSQHFADHDAGEALAMGIPAGFLIAALVWMLPSAKGSELLVIMLMTYLIAMGGFTHVVAGSSEAFLLLLDGRIGVTHAFLGLIAPTFLGNVVGGTGLFTLLAWGQVKDEI